MDRKYRESKPSKTIVFIGDNFINTYIYENFKRYSNLKPYICKNINELTRSYDYILDCTFNQKSQDNTINFAVTNKLSKVVIINHWKRDFRNTEGVSIIQTIVPDVYGTEHMSFYRPGAGNNFDTCVNFCTLICESIRRIHESRCDQLPHMYISYGEEKVKYIYVENLYEPLNYIINEIDNSCYFEIYDDVKSVTEILSIVKEVIEYEGEIIFENTNTIFNKSVRKLDYKHNHKPLKNMVKIIYQYLLCNNNRFNFG